MLLPPLRDLHRRWWCNATVDLTTANAIISLPEFSLTSILSLSSHRLLIRQEYIILFNRLRLFCTTAPLWYSRGVIVTGQPGIEKSMFLLYALLRHPQNGDPLLFHMKKQTYAIFANGVFEVDPACLPEIITVPMCALIDSVGGEKAPPPDELLSSHFITRRATISQFQSNSSGCRFRHGSLV